MEASDKDKGGGHIVSRSVLMDYFKPMFDKMSDVDYKKMWEKDFERSSELKNKDFPGEFPEMPENQFYLKGSE